MSLTNLTTLQLALRTQFHNHQMDAAVEHSDAAAWKEAALGGMSCLEEYDRRQGHPQAVEIAAYRQQVESNAFQLAMV